MIFLIGLMFACLFLLLWLEKVPWEDELEIRRSSNRAARMNDGGRAIAKQLIRNATGVRQ